jgi:hypothetical protein
MQIACFSGEKYVHRLVYFVGEKRLSFFDLVAFLDQAFRQDRVGFVGIDACEMDDLDYRLLLRFKKRYYLFAAS